MEGGGIIVTYISVEGEFTSETVYKLKVKRLLFILLGLFWFLKKIPMSSDSY